MIIDKNTANSLIKTFNSYSTLYKSGNTDVLPAMGRIMAALENDGYEIIVTNYGYQCVKKSIADAIMIEYKNDLIPYNIAVSLMDADIMERLHMELSPCSNQEFFNAYVVAHQEKYSSEFLCDNGGRLCY